MPLFHFDTTPLKAKPPRSELRAIKRDALATEAGRALYRKKRGLMVRWVGLALGALVVDAALILGIVTKTLPAEQLRLVFIIGLFFLVAAGVFVPIFVSSFLLQWHYTSTHRRFTKANGLSYVEGGPLHVRHGLPFLQGDERENIIRYQSLRGPDFEIGSFRYRLKVPITRSTATGRKRVNWSFVRIALPPGTNVPRIVVRPANDLSPASPAWALFDRLVPYWTNPGVGLQDPAGHVLFAPPEAMQVARMFFTPALVALLQFDGRPLEAEVVGDQFFVYKRNFPFVLATRKTIAFLTDVLNTAEVSLFARFPVAPHVEVPDAPPTVAHLGRRSFEVTGPPASSMALVAP